MTDHSGFKALTKIDMDYKKIEKLGSPAADTDADRVDARNTKIAGPYMNIKNGNYNYAGVHATINDDNVDSFTPGQDTGIILIAGATDDGQEWFGMFGYSIVEDDFCVKMFGKAEIDTDTKALNGTTGVDGHITVSADHTTNKIYIENRTGAQIILNKILFGY